MSNENQTQQRARIDVKDFLYKKQFRRRMNPIYIPLTKEGFILFILAYFVFIKFDGGAVSLLIFGVLIAFIYKNRFSYSYSEFEQLWVIKNISLFLNKRRRRTIESKPFVFSPNKIKKDKKII